MTLFGDHRRRAKWLVAALVVVQQCQVVAADGEIRVVFDPDRSPVPGDTETVVDVEVVTTATFSQPGTYVLRARASDGTTNGGGPGTTQALVTVEVEPGQAGADRSGSRAVATAPALSQSIQRSHRHAF